MDALYDVVESVHIFIPIVAVIFLVVMLFLFNRGMGGGGEPPAEYMSQFHQFDEKPVAASVNFGLPKPSKKSKKKTDASVVTRKPKSVNVGKSDDPVRHRPTTQTVEDVDAGDWVTVSPKKIKSPPSSSMKSATEASFEKAMSAIQATIAENATPKNIAEDSARREDEHKRSSSTDEDIEDENLLATIDASNVAEISYTRDYTPVEPEPPVRADMSTTKVKKGKKSGDADEPSSAAPSEEWRTAVPKPGARRRVRRDD